MSHVVCMLNVEADRATFSWAEGPASFEPYTLDGLVYKEFKQTAEAAREKLADLIKDYLYGEEHVPQASFALAEAGYEVYEALFDPGADQKRQARQVRKWLEKLAQQHEVDTLEIVFESPWTLPWNVIYDQEPDEDEFLQAGGSPDRWRPFWGLRYNLCGGRKVDPLRRMPVLIEPNVLMVVDTEIFDGLPDEQQQRLSAFAEEHGLTVVHTKRELKAATKAQRPDCLYWLSHAQPDALILSDEQVSPRDLRKLLKQDDEEDLGFGGLAFLNACQTAEGSQEEGSFFEAFHSVGFAGMIGTEHQTIDQFANPLGLDFLEAFLDRGEPVGSALQQLRARVPLGLLYGTYCPPDIRVQHEAGRETVDIEETARVTGTALGVQLAPDETVTRAPLPPLPPEPYRSLAFYERDDRALFAGRDDDIERFATLLDDAGTRLVALHGESGVGKSSFLHAGVIPFLEEECIGYRFLRVSDHGAGQSAGSPSSVLFVRATNDLFGQLAHVLCEFCSQPYEYRTPLGESASVDLPALLREFVGSAASQATLRALLRSEVALFGQILAAMSDRLPFSAILVIDQAEETFTLAQTPEDHVRGRRALEMLRHTVDAGGDFKVILSMRTEYYGRIIDRLRRGFHDTLSVREYLLTDFDEKGLVDAILRPTIGEPIPHTADVPFVKYGFRYADGVAEDIAHRVVRYTTQRHDSVLPLMQVICAQLYRLARRRDDTTITIEDLEGLGGIEGGMRKHVEGLLGELLEPQPRDKKPLQRLFTQLYLKQPDGTLTTALLPEQEMRRRWTGRMEFAELLESSQSMRLLKVNTLRIGFEEERRYVSLGHDSLACLAADWDEELSRGARMRKMATAIGIVSAVALVMTLLAMWAVVQGERAKISEAKAWVSEEDAKISEGKAILARLEAEANLAKAVEAVDRYFTVVSEDTLLNQAGTQELRKQLLFDAKAFLEDFADQYAGDPQVEESVAQALFNLGRICEEVDSNPTAALEYYRKARRIQAKLAGLEYAGLASIASETDLPEVEPERLAALGDTLNGMGRSYHKSVKGLGDIERINAGLGEYAGAIAIRKRLWEGAGHPTTGSQAELQRLALYQRRLADANMNLGLLKQLLEDYDVEDVTYNWKLDETALEHFERAQDLRQHLVVERAADKTDSEQDLKVQRERARGFYNLARLFDQRARTIEDAVKASELLEKCGMDDAASQVVEYEAKLETTPMDSEAERNLAQAKTRYGKVLAKRGTDYADLAIENYEAVIAKTPNDFDAHRDLAQTHILNGKLVFEYHDGGGQAGLELIFQAKVRMEEVVKLNPEVVSYRVTLGWAYDELGVYQRRYAVAHQTEDAVDRQLTSDRLRAARESLLKAIEILGDCPYTGTAKSALDEARETLGQVEDLQKTFESVNDS